MSSAGMMGNFLLTFNSVVPFEQITPYTKIIGSVLGCGYLAPAEGWVFTQLWKVPTSDGSEHWYNNDNLTSELHCNPCFAHALFGMQPHWQQMLANILHIPTVMVIVPLVDPTDSFVLNTSNQGVFMFGKRVKFVVSGNSPHLIQCGWCYQLGHPSHTPLCKLHPGVIKCYHCRGSHHSPNHDYKCNGQ